MNSDMPVALVTAISVHSLMVERAAAVGNVGGARRRAIATWSIRRLG
jgi:hypothetical protein